jgi:hypothetical protein
MNNGNAWRFTALPARFLFVDAYAVFAIILFLFHMSSETIVLTIVTIFILAIAERKSLPPAAFVLYLRAHAGQALAGGRRSLPDFQSIKSKL